MPASSRVVEPMRLTLGAAALELAQSAEAAPGAEIVLRVDGPIADLTSIAPSLVPEGVTAEGTVSAEVLLGERLSTLQPTGQATLDVSGAQARRAGTGARREGRCRSRHAGDPRERAGRHGARQSGRRPRHRPDVSGFATSRSMAGAAGETGDLLAEVHAWPWLPCSRHCGPGDAGSHGHAERDGRRHRVGATPRRGARHAARRTPAR